jgi:hypothetical protein
MTHVQRERRSAENDYLKALQALCIDLGDLSTRNSTSSYRGSHGSFVSNSRQIKPVRIVDHENQDIVRQLISEQKFDGLWNMNSTSIEQLIRKLLTNFQQLADAQVLTSAIIIVVIEIRFASLSSMWYGVVQKARKRLIDILDKNNEKLDTLLENIRKQL